MKKKVVILGGGLTGLAVASFLGNDIEYILIEKLLQIGGLTRTIFLGGFKFDLGPHAWYSPLEELNSWFESSMDGNPYRTFPRRAKVNVYGRRIWAPFQFNLEGLPPSVKAECALDFLRSKASDREIFGEWAESVFGAGIYRHFLEPYNRKLWCMDPMKMSRDWEKLWIPSPNIDEFIYGCFGFPLSSVGRNAILSYPELGMQVLCDSIMSRIKEFGNCILLGQKCKVIRKKKQILLTDETISYDRLISTIPLPRLVPRYGNKLYNTKVLLVNVMLKTRRTDDQVHWEYIPEDRYRFYRVSFPGAFSDENVPKGKWSMQAEVAFPSYDLVNGKEVERGVVAELVDLGYFEVDDILDTKCIWIDPAYVVHTLDRKEIVDSLKAELLSQGIYTCGRFGSWRHMNMADCVMEAKEAAEWAKT